MSNVVNKIIFNCLVQYGNVALPEVGSLRVEGSPKHVFFSEKSSEHHILVTEIIAEQGSLSAEEALTLYHDWLYGARREDGSIHAEGVGVIYPRRFDIDNELHRALNGHDIPVAVLQQRKSYGWVWWLIGLLALAGVAIWIMNPSKQQTSVVVEEKIVVEEAVEGQTATEEPVVEEAEKAPATTTAVRPAENKRYNVMVGVFTIKYNARACAKQDPLSIGRDNYLITPYPRGLWAVVAYSTDNLADAERMRKQYKRLQSDVWVWRRY